MRIATETSLSPGWLLIAFPAVLYPVYLVLEVLFGRGLAAATDFGGDFEAWTAPLNTTMLGYLAMMLTYVARGAFRDLEALRPVLRDSEATYAELQRKLTQFERRRLWIGGLLGFAFACLLQELSVGRCTRLLEGAWSLRDAGLAAILFALWITVGRGLTYLVDSARLYSRIGEQHLEVDLLDLVPLSPLTRHGLRIVLFLVIATGAWLVAVTVGAPPAPGSTIALVFLTCLCVLPVGAAAFALPVRGLRRQIRARKREGLAKVRENIRVDHDLVAQRGPDSAEAAARLPGLMALEKRIESVREWPFDAPTLTRFFLYVAIPLGSWVGGALVERLLGAALD